MISTPEYSPVTSSRNSLNESVASTPQYPCDQDSWQLLTPPRHMSAINIYEEDDNDDDGSSNEQPTINPPNQGDLEESHEDAEATCMADTNESR